MPNFNVDKTVINLPLGDGRLPLSYDDFVEIVYEIIWNLVNPTLNILQRSSINNNHQ